MIKLGTHHPSRTRRTRNKNPFPLRPRPRNRPERRVYKQRLIRRLYRHGHRRRLRKRQRLRLKRQLGRCAKSVFAARTGTVEICAGVDFGARLEGGVGRCGDDGSGHVEAGDEIVEL